MASAKIRCQLIYLVSRHLIKIPASNMEFSFLPFSLKTSPFPLFKLPILRLSMRYLACEEFLRSIYTFSFSHA